MARVKAFMYIKSRRAPRCNASLPEAKLAKKMCRAFGAIQLYFFWLFLLGGSLNWTILKYRNVPKKCRKAVEDTNTGNKSGRCGGGARATVTMLRPAMAATLM